MEALGRGEDGDAESGPHDERDREADAARRSETLLFQGARRFSRSG